MKRITNPFDFQNRINFMYKMYIPLTGKLNSYKLLNSLHTGLINQAPAIIGLSSLIPCKEKCH
ncbi:MAG: hypothetical protein KAW85_04215, partial [Candidatus Aminicenantes bacterium]|nr:hypothetical protein [Candidatus Aminicenantes bacterium]